MGQKEVNISISANYNNKDLEQQIHRKFRLKEFKYKIIRKSLDSRKKDRIHWQIRIMLESAEIKENEAATGPSPLEIPKITTASPRIIIAGSGPGGIFAALFLQKAGCRVTLLERGKKVYERASDIERLEKEGIFTENSNYSFGEGGAGTFSDGKLTSRSKHIKKERLYILEEFVKHGAPEEILYLAHPHIGSDKLVPIARSMRAEFEKLGGKIHFGCTVQDMEIKEGRVKAVTTELGSLEASYFIFATGHSALDTFRMLISRGVPYIPKNFALGFRMEHKQETINSIQWGCPSLEGVKAAEYRLTSGKADVPVYSFCMCPGGKVVPAASFKDTNIVNGMSYYERDGVFANAAFVAGVSPQLIKGSGTTALESLNWLEALEKKFYNAAPDYKAPAIPIRDFLKSEFPSNLLPSSYEPGLIPADLGGMLPESVSTALRLGLQDICARLPGWDKGQLIGLESKTSSPVQVLRDRNSGLTDGFDNLFICGEASGWSGGIISSASDGLKTAISICNSLL